jgi:hypothetical protein
MATSFLVDGQDALISEFLPIWVFEFPGTKKKGSGEPLPGKESEQF